MVLHQNPKITAKTAGRVRKVMDEVGYRPNRLAQSLSGKYTRVLAVLMPTLRHAMADPYFGELLSGVIDKAERLGHKVMLDHAKPDFIRDHRHIDLFERRFADGLLLIGFNDQHKFLKDFAERDLPAMLVNNRVEVPGADELDHVVANYRSGAEQVMTCLLQLGHRCIGMIHGSLLTHTAREMLDVYKKHLGESCDEMRPNLDDWLVDGRFTEEGGAAAADELLDRHPDLTALFVGNDKMALGALQRLGERGVRVPEDVSVVGFDDLRYASWVRPPLTTVHLPLYEVGQLACERLIERVRGRAEPVREVLPPHLVLRKSTGLVRGRA